MSASERGSAASLREQFDSVFAAPERLEHAATEDYLVIGVGADRFALRLSEVSGLLVDRKIVLVPSSTAALLGVVGLRGTVAPVYDLRVLLGYAPSGNPRWLFLARSSEPVAFAFDRFEAHRRLPVERAVAAGAEEHARPHLRGSLPTTDSAHPVIHVASLLQSIARGTELSSKER